MSPGASPAHIAPATSATPKRAQRPARAITRLARQRGSAVVRVDCRLYRVGADIELARLYRLGRRDVAPRPRPAPSRSAQRCARPPPAANTSPSKHGANAHAHINDTATLH